MIFALSLKTVLAVLDQLTREQLRQLMGNPSEDVAAFARAAYYARPLRLSGAVTHATDSITLL